MKKREKKQNPDLPSLVPPWAAALLSLLVPGLGQALARSVRRGILILGSVLAIAGMLVWRVGALGRLQKTPAAIMAKALELQPGFVIICSPAWCWSGWQARGTPRSARSRSGAAPCCSA